MGGQDSKCASEDSTSSNAGRVLREPSRQSILQWGRRRSTNAAPGGVVRFGALQEQSIRHVNMGFGQGRASNTKESGSTFRAMSRRFSTRSRRESATARRKENTCASPNVPVPVPQQPTVPQFTALKPLAS
mmetsp:Transcript_29761/g.68328  ORF Transcript_29761/g.68328 Transcript_29761/m.68328 type:complete len:131 (-) Transcript_29761:143-535(-)